MLRLKRSCALFCASLLLVACGGGGSGGSEPTALPTANAGADQTVEMGTVVTLDGRNSESPRSDATLSYTWSLTQAPAQSTAELSDDTAAQPTFKVDLPGTYKASLVVNDGTADSGQDLVTITATNPDPVAITQAEHRVLVGTTVLLDGSESLPPTGGDVSQLEYEWTLDNAPQGSTATLVQTGTSMVSLYTEMAGTYSATLVVHYQGTESDPATVTIEAANTNTRPVADAGGPYTIERGQTLTLDGTGSSDADGDSLSYRWYMINIGSDSGYRPIGIPNGSMFAAEDALQGYDTATPTLTPDVAGRWFVHLVVHDGTSVSNFATANVTVTVPDGEPNTPPVASFYTTPRVKFVSQVYSDEVELGTTISGSGNSYDLDGNWIGSSNRRYQWISTPAGYAAEDLEGSGSFIFTPTVEGDYTVEMIVNDGEADSEPVRRTLTARTGANKAPSARVTVDAQTLLMGETGWFDGTESEDFNDDPLTYHWYLLDQPDGSTAQLQYQSVTRPDGTVLTNARAGIATDAPGIYVVLLVVEDSFGVTGPIASVQFGRILVKSENNRPEIGSINNNNDHYRIRRRNTHFNDTDQPLIISPQTESVQIYAQGAVDPDLDTLYYLWTLEQPAGSTLTDAADTADFNPGIPTVAGHYSATLVVSDGIDTSEPKTLNFRAVERSDYPSLLLEDHYSAELNSWDQYQRMFASDDSFPRQRAFPYWSEQDASFPVFVRKLDAGATPLKRYRLTAFGGDYTITNLHVTESTNTDYPGYTGSFSGLSEGQVIANGDSVEFEVLVHAPGGEDTTSPTNNLVEGMTFSFEVAEKPGWRFHYAPFIY